MKVGHPSIIVDFSWYIQSLVVYASLAEFKLAHCNIVSVLPRHSFCSRLIYTAIPARCYNGDATIFDLLQHLADDCCDLFWNGLDVPPMAIRFWIQSTGFRML